LLYNRYAVPFDTTPPLIESLSDDFTIYFLKRSLNPGVGDLDDKTQGEYRATIETLKDIAVGRIDLLDSDGNKVPTKTTISSNTENYPSAIFDLDAVESHEIDSDRLDDIKTNRGEI